MTSRYKVTGPTAFQGHQPGEEFDADLDQQLERRAKDRGQIRVVLHDISNDKPEKEDQVDA